MDQQILQRFQMIMQPKLRVLYYCLKLLIVKITQMEYKQRLLNFHIQLMIIKLKSRIFFYARGEDRYLFYQQNQQILDAISIKEEQIPVLFLGQSMNQLNGKIYVIEKDSQNFVITYINMSIEFLKQVIQSNFFLNPIKQFTQFVTKTLKKNPQNQGNNDQYITLSKLNSNLQYFFQILSFIDDHYISYGNATLFLDLILIELIDLINVDNNAKLFLSMNCQILDSIIIEGNLKIIFFRLIDNIQF
ncbi:unnamed protein product [Paramecium sonneborni]|uniref:Uncharacterized protein n=1 Tax=Paramecium sonneborni TaxID=65129 RepID=A0A8S1NMN7_9CILI|nr:unnamed protein product [Paramecium sonneborni]